MKRPAFISLLILISGRILGTFLPISSWICLTGIIFLLASEAWRLFRRDKAATPGSGGLLFFAVLFLGLYQQRLIVEDDYTSEQIAKTLSERPLVTIKGRLADEPDFYQNTCKFPVRDLHLLQDGVSYPINTRALVFVYGDVAKGLAEKDPACGDFITICAHALIPPSLRNPTLFNYRAYLRLKGIHLMFRINVKNAVETSPPPYGRSIFYSLYHSISHLRVIADEIFNSNLSAKNAAMLKGITRSETHDISREEREDFFRTGLVHLFAVSGLHVGMFAVFIIFILRLTHLNIRIVSILTIIFIWSFCAYVGFRTPVVRTSIMVTCLLASYWLPGLRRPLESLSLISFAAFWTLIFNPRALFQADFQFSYVCVYAIIIFMPFFENHLMFNLERLPQEKKGRRAIINRFVLRPLFVVISIQIALLPLMAYYFQKMSLVALVANLIIIPLVFLCLNGGILMITLGALFPFTLSLLGGLTEIALNLLRWVVQQLSHFPFAMVYLPSLTWIVVGVYYVALLSGNWILERREWKQRRKIAFILTTLFLAALLLWFSILPRGKPEVEVVFLDVGQGDSIYVEFAGGTNMLIDGGRGYPRDMGAEVISEFLERRGIDSIDVVVASHPDADHIGGLPSIFNRFFVDMLIEGESTPNSAQYATLYQKAREWGIVRKSVSRGDELTGFDGAEMLVLNPPRPTPETWNDNNRSVVLLLKTKDAGFLFTGDAEVKAEHNMCASGVDLHVTVLKVGHHGSRTATSEEFLKNVHPIIAVISAGKGNIYHHPHTEVLNRLKTHGIRIYRTDEQGAITMQVRRGKIITKTEE